MLAMGQGALGDVGGRLRWIDANLREPSWRQRIGVESVDVALSTTALHWLPPDQLVRLYTELGTLIRPDGLFLDGDHMAYATGMEPFARVRDMVSQRDERAAEQDGAESWRGWWDAATSEPALAELVAERERRLPESGHGDFAADLRPPRRRARERRLPLGRRALAAPRRPCPPRGAVSSHQRSEFTRESDSPCY